MVRGIMNSPIVISANRPPINVYQMSSSAGVSYKTRTLNES